MSDSTVKRRRCWPWKHEWTNWEVMYGMSATIAPDTFKYLRRSCKKCPLVQRRFYDEMTPEGPIR